MKPSEVETQLINHYKARTSIFIWGAPGVGKSDIVRKVRNELNIGLVDQRLSQ